MAQLKIDSDFGAFLDLSRWLSAFMVLFTHSRSVVFVPWEQVSNKNLFNTAVYFLSGFGHYGVIVFFAISGFLIGGSTLERYAAGNFSYRGYFINRFSRIYIVLVPALLLVGLLDHAGITWLNGSGIYTQGYPVGSLGADVSQRLGLETGFGNLLMLQNISVPTFGSAMPLWSLNWEWWSYLLGPGVLWLLLQLGGWRRVALLSAVAALLLWALGLYYVFLWHFGVLLHYIHRRSRALLLFGISAIIVTPAVTRAWNLPPAFPADFAFMAGFIALASQLRHLRFSRLGRINKGLADFSYSLYILHNSFLVFIMAGLQTFLSFPQQLQPAPESYLIYIGVLVVVLALSWLFARFTEHYTRNLRRLLYRLLR